MIKIDELIKDAMKSGEKERLNTLKLIKSKLMLEKCKPGRNKDIELTEAEELVVLGKMKSEYVDSIAKYKEGGRQDLVEQEEKELAIVESFLPKEPTAEEIEAFILQDIQDYNKDGRTLGMADMKPLMERARNKFPLSGKLISSTLLKILKK